MTMRKLLIIFTLLLLLVSCEKEIDINYHEIDTMVVIEGRVTNEGTEVSVRRSRSVTDSVRSLSLPGASITVFDNETAHLLAYDPSDGCYRSDMKGIPGHNYRMAVDFEGKHYEAVSTMPAPPFTIGLTATHPTRTSLQRCKAGHTVGMSSMTVVILQDECFATSTV